MVNWSREDAAIIMVYGFFNLFLLVLLVPLGPVLLSLGRTLETDVGVPALNPRQKFLDCLQQIRVRLALLRPNQVVVGVVDLTELALLLVNGPAACNFGGGIISQFVEIHIVAIYDLFSSCNAEV